MGHLKGTALFGLLFFLAGGLAGLAADVSKDQARQAVTAKADDLRQAQAGLATAKDDLDLAQGMLDFTNGVAHTTQEKESYQTRVDQDKSDIQSCTARIQSDTDFLKAHWNILTAEERELAQ